MCGGGIGGEGPVTSFKVNLNFPKFQGVQHMLSGVGGGGRQTFFQGDGVQLLSDRTYDLYWTPVPDPRNFQEFQWTTVILFLAVYFRLSSCTHLDACFTLILKCDLAGSLFYRCVSMNGFCAWIKAYCRFSACKLG